MLREARTPRMLVATNSRPRSFWEGCPSFRRGRRAIPVLDRPGEMVMVEYLWCRMEFWESLRESQDPAWEAVTVGPFVSAFRAL